MNSFLIFLLLQVLMTAKSAPSRRFVLDDDKIPISVQYLKLLNQFAVGKPDYNGTTGLAVSRYSPSYSFLAEELGSYFEGDILYPTSKRNGLISSIRRWRNGVVPFIIEGDFDYHQWLIIEKSFAEYHSKTCVRFVPRTWEHDFIAITSENTGCWSSIGKMGGRQEVNLQPAGCFMHPGTTIHELMHALGFLHEQNRHERDDFVKINYENIKPKAKNNFYKSSPYNSNGFGVTYDFASIMHYSVHAFSMNGNRTITPKKKILPGVKIGQRRGFSEKDLLKINTMYKCEGRKKQKLSAKNNNRM